MTSMDTPRKCHPPSLVGPTLIGFLILIPALCSAIDVNCSEPNQPALLKALNPLFNLSAIRPVMNLTTPTMITTSFTMYGILGVDEKAQLLETYIWLHYWWHNEFVSWDPAQCGTHKISLPRAKFWVPDIVINEFMDENTAPLVPYVYLHSDGRVHDALPVKVISSCNLDIYTFPFDIQNCTMTFNSYLHYAMDIQISLWKSAENITQSSKRVMTTMGEWELLEITSKKIEKGQDKAEYIDELTFNVRVRRRATLYVVNLLIPSCFLITVDLFSFLLPPQAVDRSAFKMTLILGYTVFLLIMNDLLPITGNTIPLINVFFSLCLALMVASLLETILITNLLNGAADFPPVPHWIRVIVLQFLGCIVCLPQKPKTRKDFDLKSVFAKPRADDGPPEGAGSGAEGKTLQELRGLRTDLQAIRQQVEQQLVKSQSSEEWIQVGFIIDRLLFGIYILFVSVSFITIIIIWVNYTPCSPTMLNCTQPDPPSLLNALRPVFNLSSIRPVMNMSTSTNVTIGFVLVGILGVDEKAQLLTTYIWQTLMWKNEFVSWDPNQCGSYWTTIPRELLWVPDIVINEFMGKNTAPFVPYSYLYSNGLVVDAKPIKVVSSCRLDIYTFPFDTQNCSLSFNSYLHTMSAINVSHSSVKEIYKRSVEVMSTMGEWELTGITAATYLFPTSVGDDYQEIRFFISVRRRATLYVVNLLIPSCFLIAIDLFSFLLPPKSVDRSLFKMTLILGYTVFLLSMNDLLPITGETIPLINVFLSLCLTMMVGSLLETIVITNLLCGSAHYAPVPCFIRVLVLHILGRLVLLPPKPKDQEDTVIQNPATQEINVSSVVSDIHKTQEQNRPLDEDQALQELRSLGGELRDLRLQLKQQVAGDQSSEDWIQVGFAASLNCSSPTPESLFDALEVELFSKKMLRPVKRFSDTLNVSIDITLVGILGVNEKAQSLTTYLWQVLQWKIDGLSWDERECGTTRVTVPRQNLWVPDVLITEFMDEDVSPQTPYVYLYNTGLVYDDKPKRVVSSCRLEIYTFPFDIQNCSLTFQPYIHFAEDIQMVQSRTANEIFIESKNVLQTKGEWELVDIKADPSTMAIAEGGFSEVKFYIILRRRPILYVVNLLIPSCFLITVDLFSFFLPPHSVDRGAFKMTLILGYTVFLLIMNDLLPVTGDTTPLMNVLFSLSLALMVASLLETVFITNLQFSSSQYSAVPKWLSILVLQYLARVVCLPPKKKSNRVTVSLHPPNRPIDTITVSVRDLPGVYPDKPPPEPALDELRKLSRDLTAIRVQIDKQMEGSSTSQEWLMIGIVVDLFLCESKLTCKDGHSGPTYESMQDVFDLKPFRPAVNLSNPTIANISFTLYAVLGVNEKTQILTTFLWLRLYWHHEFLVWEPEECDGVTRISLPVKKLWSPDIIVYEFVDDDVSQACPYVYVNHTGHIRWDRMLRLVSACNLEIFSFPFDVQNCTFTFGSYMHTIRDVRVSPALTFTEMSRNSKRYLEASGEWELVDILGETSILTFGIDEWDIITFWVVIKRRPVLYVVNLLIPSSFLMLIDILSFYLPPHSVDRASFKMTLILGYTVFLLIMNDLLPSTANGTPIIGIYFSVCLALMVISLLETVIITNVLHHNSMKYREVPNWVRVVVLKHIANLICYRQPEDAQPPVTPHGDKADSSNSSTTGPWIIQPANRPPAQNLTDGGVASLPELQQICQYLGDLRAHLTSLQKESELQDQWCHVGYVLDFLLFRIYLLLISCYALVIISMWCIWISQ
ncbi:uncharacterized protein LOC124873912 [Xyrichtys novacula]|uniref:Uncharacterized protein LOC124873912 n=1 Tax=Xyrichtys novacula TaxID=13765 RepID=A0AAV1FJU2_XYRNO|nr:uncharacterized protein LOC124873912 [Xyrichtys novacula]